MKTASTLAPQLIVPCVLRCVDERLAEVSSAKSALRAFSVAFDAESSCDASVRRSSDSTKDGSMATSPLETMLRRLLVGGQRGILNLAVCLLTGCLSVVVHGKGGVLVVVASEEMARMY